MSTSLQEGIQENIYHAAYSDLDANLVLVSTDGIKFRVYPLILRMASEVFSNMITGAMDTGDPVELQDKSDTLKMLLDFIHPNAPYYALEGQDFESVWALLIAADKYGVRKIMEEFRSRLLSDPYFTHRSLESFVIATYFGWKKEASATTVGALDDLNKPYSWGLLNRLDVTQILKLQKFVRMRKIAMIDAVRMSLINGSLTFLPRGVFQTSLTGGSHEIYSLTLVAYVDRELGKCPSGRTLQQEFWTRADVKWLLDPDAATALRQEADRAYRNLPYSVDDVYLD